MLKIAARTGVLVCWAVAVSLSGCGGDVGDRPELGQVSGKVTLDDKPLVGALILFRPEEGRTATGTIGSDGSYTLEYLYKVPGCKVGPNIVSLTWPTGEGGVAIPAKYAEKTELKVEVFPGSNTFDFPLKSKD